MGGKNHQPCSPYLKESTKLSRSLSLARSSLELANVGLEDVILAELDDKAYSCDMLVSHLSASLEFITEAKGNIIALCKKMNDFNFKDLSSLFTIDFDALGRKLVKNGMVEASAWQSVVATAKQGGFRAVFNIIEQKLENLDQYTRALQLQVTKLCMSATSIKVNVILEKNLADNIKVNFAKLYNEWSAFDQFFLASSLSSTEQWYIFMGFGSLVGESILLPQKSPIHAKQEVFA